jgi:hypothetical protein
MKKLHIFLIALVFAALPTRQIYAAKSLGAASKYVVLALENGSLIINSSHLLVGDVGYSKGVKSQTNQKVDTFIGTVYVHSQVSQFNYTSATFQPSGGIIQNNVTADAQLNQANIDALAASVNYAGLTPDYTYGNVTTSLTINRTGSVTVVNMASLNYNYGVLNLIGSSGGTDSFIFNIAGNFDFSHASINLTNVNPANVIFNFPNASFININKADNVFRGIILAPIGNVDYHNPASFVGAIIALDIVLHSDFRIEYPGGGGVIPVSWLDFTGKKQSPGLVELKWSTAQEINNDYFEIERSADLNSWVNVCHVKGNGNSNERNNYSCIDSSADQSSTGTVYYRPKQVDFNGAYEYYKIIKLRLENIDGQSLVQAIYPNPSKDRLTIKYHALEAEAVNISLMNMEGKVILHSVYIAKPGEQAIDINLIENKLSSGFYMLTVESTNEVFRQKVYKLE